MEKFTIMIVSSLFGTLFWFLGNLISPDFGFWMSILGGFVGLFFGVKWIIRYS